jgi:aminoglycoside phosphotransferase (APT) family kinase protein
MVIWQPVAGAAIEPYLDTTRGGAYVCATAGALAALHALPPLSARGRPVTAELERFHNRATNVARVAPATGRHLIEWASALVERRNCVGDGEAGLVHGDCKPSQFRIDGSQIALLDFDHCGVADQASDVGTFLASLRQRGRQSLEERFAVAYNACSGRAAAPWDRIAWYESVALMRKALRAFARSPRSPLPVLFAREGLRCLRTLPSGEGCS